MCEQVSRVTTETGSVTIRSMCV